MSQTPDGADAVVIGSGAAACAAALRSARGGMSVVVVEKSDKLGGTSAMSGAGIWVPANHIAAREGIADSREEALQYIRHASPVGWAETEDGLWTAFVDNAPRMLEFIDANPPLDLRVIDEPDPIMEAPGGKGIGRMVSPMPLSRRLLGPLAPRLRRSTLPHLFTYQEVVGHDLYHHPIRAGFALWPRLLRRTLTNSGGQGTALMTGLIRGCLDAGVTFLTETPAHALVTDETGAVTGVEIGAEGTRRTLAARRGVVIASGGFEWDSARYDNHFPGPKDRIGTPRTNTGDGQRMAEAVGAKLDRMDQANVYPCLPTRYEGRLHGMPMTFQAEPHSIIVNARADRFASESDYNIGEHLDARDPATGEPVNLPAWLIADVRFLSTSLPFRWYQSYEKGWLRKAPTLDALATEIGLPPAALKETVEAFNRMLRESGRDTRFGRGEAGWEAYKNHATAATGTGLEAAKAKGLGTIEKAPFIALSMNRSTIGTKGGARTNEKAQVLRPDGSVIAGLYAAGLAMANPFGTRAVGAGTTIGPNMTWGFIAAETMLTGNRG